MTQNPLDICLCTADFVGPVRNGGIGTAYHALARTLREAGHRVTVLYALGEWCERGVIGDWVEHYRAAGIEFVPVPRSRDALAASSPYLRNSYETYLWLAEQESRGRRFDFIHFHEWRGLGFHSTLAKRQALNFAGSVICIGTHSPELWHLAGMNQRPATLEDLQADFMERSSVRWADAVVSPSQYMLDWMREHGWILPKAAMVRPNILLDARPMQTLAEAGTSPIQEIVFFGRLETRKGLPLFCDAVDRLLADTTFVAAQPRLQITFLGKGTLIDGVASAKYLDRRGKSWPLARRILDDLDHAAAMKYLRQPGRLAVMPSLMENSPYTLLECLGNGIACLCTDLPGNRELIAPADAERIVFRPTAADLAGKLKLTVASGLKPALPSVDPQSVRQQWISWHEESVGKFPGPLVPAEKPLVTVCIAHRNRPSMAAQAIESIRRQDYPNVQVVLADDGSDTAEATQFLADLEKEFAEKKWKIVRQSNRYLGAARNAAAAAADGEWLLFMDDDNFAAPEEISTFVTAALASGADMLTCLAACFKGSDAPVMGTTEREIWLPLGGAVAVGVFLNLYGDANGLVRRAVFEKLGGYTEDFGVGHEDWELYAKAALAGHTVAVVPRPLFWYRVHSTSMLRTTSHYINHMRSLRPYVDNVGPELSQALMLAQAMFFGQGREAPATSAQAPPPPRPQVAAPPLSPDQNGENPQALVDEYWDSFSWRLTGMGRRMFAGLLGKPNASRPLVTNRREAMIAIENIRRSISWEATGPLRAIGRVLHAFRHRSNGSAD
ncbi:MAG: glycosyltransferase [Tepidisphaeraceae bacterium]|jgi:glycosyltransferase involved in cell wall biosynthesis/GT2 family glycosyltransferase